MFKQRENINCIIILLFIGVLCCVIAICVSVFANKEDKHVHSYDEWVVVKNPDCVNGGLRERYCTCGEKQESAIATLGHELVTVEQKPAICTEEGHEEYVKCSRCDYSTYKVINALGHDFGEWEIVTESTCYSLGLEKRVCKRDETHVETRQIEKAPHTMPAWSTA